MHVSDSILLCVFFLFLAAFHYSSKAANLVENQVASRSKACRKAAANLLKTFFFYTNYSICLARARTSEPAAVRDQVFDKKSRKRVTNPHELVENLAANLIENQVCSLARIMECGLYRVQTDDRRTTHDVSRT